MSVTLSVLEGEGYHNFEGIFDNNIAAQRELNYFKLHGGYWVRKHGDMVYVPWHRVRHARIEENNAD